MIDIAVIKFGDIVRATGTIVDIKHHDDEGQGWAIHGQPWGAEVRLPSRTDLFGLSELERVGTAAASADDFQVGDVVTWTGRVHLVLDKPFEWEWGTFHLYANGPRRGETLFNAEDLDLVECVSAESATAHLANLRARWINEQSETFEYLLTIMPQLGDFPRKDELITRFQSVLGALLGTHALLEEIAGCSVTERRVSAGEGGALCDPWDFGIEADGVVRARPEVRKHFR